MTTALAVAADLVASDERYFELGARIEPVAGARLAWMPGLADLLAGCVVLGADAWRDGREAERALAEVEARVADVGGSRVRLYLARARSDVARALTDRGYVARHEDGLVLTGRLSGAERVALRRVADDADWDLKATLHRESPDTCDGHAMEPERWVELERRKVDAGGLAPWLILEGEAPVGTAGTMRVGGLLRLKNLLVHRDRRRRGVATAAIAAFRTMAEREGRAFGFFGVEGTPGELVYRKCGMTPVTRWTEWLGPPRDGDREA